MPICSGARGQPGILAIPGRVVGLGRAGSRYSHSFGRKKRFRSWRNRLAINGVTTFYQTMAASAVGVAGLTKFSTFARTLAVTAIGVAGLTTVPTFARTLAATAVGVAGLTKGMFVTLTATAVGVAGLTTARIFARTLAAIAVGVATLTKVPTFAVTIAATAVGVASLSRIATFSRTIAATAVGVASLTKGMFVNLAATAVGAAVLATKTTILKTLSAIAVGVVTLGAPPPLANRFGRLSFSVLEIPVVRKVFAHLRTLAGETRVSGEVQFIVGLESQRPTTWAFGSVIYYCTDSLKAFYWDGESWNA